MRTNLWLISFIISGAINARCKKRQSPFIFPNSQIINEECPPTHRMGSITEHYQRNVIAHHGRALADQVRENGKCSLVSGFLSTLSEIRAPKSMTQSRSSQSCGASLSFQSLLYVGIFIPNTVMLDQKHHYIPCSHTMFPSYSSHSESVSWSEDMYTFTSPYVYMFSHRLHCFYLFLFLKYSLLMHSTCV